MAPSLIELAIRRENRLADLRKLAHSLSSIAGAQGDHPKARPRLTFEGRRYQDWQYFKKDFARVAKYHQYSDTEKRRTLRQCMRKKAERKIRDINITAFTSFEALMNVYEERLTPSPARQRSFKIIFKIRQEIRETISEFHERVAYHFSRAQLAWPDVHYIDNTAIFLIGLRLNQSVKQIHRVSPDDTDWTEILERALITPESIRFNPVPRCPISLIDAINCEAIRWNELRIPRKRVEIVDVQREEERRPIGNPTPINKDSLGDLIGDVGLSLFSDEEDDAGETTPTEEDLEEDDSDSSDGDYEVHPLDWDSTDTEDSDDSERPTPIHGVNGLTCSKKMNNENDESNPSESLPRYCPVTLMGRTLLAVIDSGNHAGIIISSELAGEICSYDISAIAPTSFNVTTAKRGKSGLLRTGGKFIIPLELRLGTYPKAFQVYPIIVSNISSDLNIGLEFLCSNRIDQIHSQGSLLVDGYSIELISGPSPPQDCPSVLQMSTLSKTTNQRIPMSLPGNQNERTYTVVPNDAGEPFVIREGRVFGTEHPRTIHPTRSRSLESEDCEKKPEREEDKMSWLEKEFHVKEAPWLQHNRVKQKEVLKLLRQYYDIFSHGDEYGRTTLVEHEIHTGEALPQSCGKRPVNPEMLDKLKEQMETWINQGVIEASSSPWSFGLLPVKKKNGKVRWVIDYRKLNDVTMKDSYPLPNIDDNLARLAHSEVFSVVDGTGAFHVVSIRKEDREKTAFHTPFGQYQFKQMPFGLCNAPATYSRLVQKVLKDIPTSVALPYMDDTCIHSRSISEHINALRDIFEAHRQAGLMLQPAKCRLFQKEVEYLGHLITSNGIKPIPGYVKLIESWPQPNTIKELRTFLGKIAYYRKFIRHFSLTSTPLYDLLSKEANQDPKHLELGNEAKQAFQDIRAALVQAPLLHYPDFESKEPFILTVGWSGCPGAVSGTLSQLSRGTEKVICFGARKLNKTEKNYPPEKGEILAVIHFIKQWKYYFQHRRFILRTCGKAIDWLMATDNPTGMILRWIEILRNSDFVMQDRENDIHVPNKISEISLIGQTDPLNIRMEQICDPDLNVVRQWITEGIKPGGKSIRGNSNELRQLHGIFETLYLDGNQVLCRQNQEGEYCNHSRICLPKSLQKKAFQMIHIQAGSHLNTINTRSKMMEVYYFPNMTKRIEQLVGDCEGCLRLTGQASDQLSPLEQNQKGKPFQEVSLEILGPLRKSDQGNSYVIIIKDCHTRWIEAIPIASCSPATITEMLKGNLFSRYGMPQRIHQTEETSIEDEDFREIRRLLNIGNGKRKCKQGIVREEHIGPLLKTTSEKTDQEWEVILPILLLALRTTRNPLTGVTPFWGLCGREAMLPLELVYKNPRDKAQLNGAYSQELAKRIAAIYRFIRNDLLLSNERSRNNYNGKMGKKGFEEKELVWIFTPNDQPNSQPWSGPWKIVRKVSNLLYYIENQGDWNAQKLSLLVSVDRMKRFKNIVGRPREKENLQFQDVLIQDEFLEHVARQPASLSRLPSEREVSNTRT